MVKCFESIFFNQYKNRPFAEMKLQSCKDTCPEANFIVGKSCLRLHFSQWGFAGRISFPFGIYVMDLSSRIILLSEATQSSFRMSKTHSECLGGKNPMSVKIRGNTNKKSRLTPDHKHCITYFSIEPDRRIISINIKKHSDR